MLNTETNTLCSVLWLYGYLQGSEGNDDQWQGLEDLSRGEGEGQMEDWSEEFKENDTDVFSDSDP